MERTLTGLQGLIQRHFIHFQKRTQVSYKRNKEGGLYLISGDSGGKVSHSVPSLLLPNKTFETKSRMRLTPIIVAIMSVRTKFDRLPLCCCS